MLTTRGYGRLVEPLTGRALEGSAVVERSSARAAEFACYGLQPRDRVFLHNGNTIDFFVDLLATWHLGACAIPIDNRLARSEIATLAAAARPRLSIWSESPAEATRGALENLAVAVIDAGSQPSSVVSAIPPFGSFSLDDAALILFTSGTTGDPKGVVHTHRSLRARWMSLFTSLGLPPFRRTLCLLPTHFGHGLICNCLFPWLFGLDLYLLPPFRPDLLATLGEVIDQHEITCLSSVPSVWRLALKIAKPPARRTLARVFCGSAPLSASLWRSIQVWTGAPVTNAYGITETASWLAGATAHDTDVEDGLVGEPWGGSLAVLPVQETAPPPDFSAACKPNEPGFVWVNTPALMKGYFERDDFTSRVVCNGWFSTGDTGVIDECGRLHLLGRVREEINKGGQKIYPADIDNVIEQFDQTVDVCTFAVPDPLHGEDIGVAVVLETPSDGVLVRLHEWTCGRLGSHQVPKRWYVVNAIPRTSRGKVNRREVAEFCDGLSPVPPSSLSRGPISK